MNEPHVELDEVLMTLVIEFLFFLDSAAPSDVDPAASERMASEIAFQLGRVEPHKLIPLIRFIRAQAESSAWPEEKAFLSNLPRLLGWE